MVDVPQPWKTAKTLFAVVWTGSARNAVCERHHVQAEGGHGMLQFDLTAELARGIERSIVPKSALILAFER